jgi:hypothetical protein
VVPDFAVDLRPIGTSFVNLIKMMISPVIFRTIVLGIGSIRQAAKVGKVGGVQGAHHQRPWCRGPRVIGSCPACAAPMSYPSARHLPRDHPAL